MQEYDRIEVSEGIYFNKTNDPKKWDICHYWYFLEEDVIYEPHLCNGWHDLLQNVINFNNVFIVSIKVSNYRIYFWYMSKDDATTIMKSCTLEKKKVDSWPTSFTRLHILPFHIAYYIIQLLLIYIQICIR